MGQFLMDFLPTLLRVSVITFENVVRRRRGFILSAV